MTSLLAGTSKSDHEPVSELETTQIPWGKSLFVVASILALIVVLATSNGGIYSADEAATHAQAELFQDNRWTVRSADIAYDPDGRWFLLENSTSASDGFAPFGKHPAFVAISGVSERAFGYVGRLFPGLVGAVIGAFFCSLLTRRITGVEVSVGAAFALLATPLLFHIQIFWGHALGFGFASLAILAATELTFRWRVWWLLAGVAAIVALTLVRTEGVLLALSLAAALLVFGPKPILKRIVAAVAIGGAGAGAEYLIEPLLLDLAFTPSNNSGAGLSSSNSFLLDRVWVLVMALFVPSIQLQWFGLLRICGLVIVTLGLRQAESVSSQPLVWVGLAVWSAGLIGPDSAPGILVALPVVTVAFLLPKKIGFPPGSRFLILGAALFTVVVLMTSHGSGGGGDWGARYLFVGLPLIIPLVVHRYITVDIGRLWLGLAGVALAAVIGMVGTVYRQHATSLALAEAGNQAILNSPIDLAADQRIIVVDKSLGRYLWAEVNNEAQLLAAEPEELSEVLSNAKSQGVSKVAWLSRQDQLLSLGSQWSATTLPSPGADLVHIQFGLEGAR